MNGDESIISKSSKENSIDQCDSCLYTGVATCSALSLYFLKMSSEPPSPLAAGTKKMSMNQIKGQKHFLLAGSAAWAIAGMYRFYLG